MVKIYSWNVNGIRAVINKGLFEPFVTSEKPDIILSPRDQSYARAGDTVVTRL